MGATSSPSYASDLLRAIETTCTEGWMDPSTELLWTLTQTREGLPDANELMDGPVNQMIQTFGWSPADLANRCVDAHHNALLSLAQRKIPALVTIGEVHVDGVPKFKVDLDRLRHEFAHPDPDADISVHVWLTLPGLQIADITIRSHLAARNHRPVEHYPWSAVGCPVHAPTGRLDTCNIVGDPVQLRWEPWIVGSTWIDRACPTIDGSLRANRLRVLINRILTA